MTEAGPSPAPLVDRHASSRIIAINYGMKGGQLSVTVRRAFLYYFLKQLGLNTEAVSKTARE
jgi:hypothetical protein